MLKRGNASLIPGIEVLAIVGVVHFSDYPRPGQPRPGGCAAWYCPGLREAAWLIGATLALCMMLEESV
jgi:hypothetical protein